MSYRALISSKDLQNHINDPKWVVFDCRFSLADKEQGRNLYEQAHIPGAHYIHMEEELSGKITSQTGRHPLPRIEDFQRTLRMKGLENDMQIVVYDDMCGMFAARLWWMMKWVGHENVALLNGGIQAWEKSGYEMQSDIPQNRVGGFVVNEQTDMVADTDEIKQLLADRACVLIDARAPERFRGEVEPIDKVAGHIPGATNVPCNVNVTDDNMMKSKESLAEIHQYDKPVVAMCGSGITACHNILANVVAGNEMPRLYAGSWSEWITDPYRRVVRS